MSPRISSVVILIGVLVAVSAQPAPQRLRALPAVRNVNLGDNITLECQTQGSGITATRFVWYHGQPTQRVVVFYEETLHDTSMTRYKLLSYTNLMSRIVIIDVHFMDHGSWECEGSFGRDPTETVRTRLSIKSPPVWQNLTQQKSFNLNENRHLELNCSAMGDPTPKVVWTGDTGSGGIILPDGRVTEYYIGSVLKLSNITQRHRGHYSCRASNGISPSIGAEFVVKVPFPPEVTVYTNVVRAPSNQTSTIGFVVRAHPQVSRQSDVTCYHDSASITNGQNGYQYSINPSNDEMETILTLTTPKVDSNVAGDYRCEVTNSRGRGEATIELIAGPSIEPDKGATRSGAAAVSSSLCLAVTVLALLGSWV